MTFPPSSNLSQLSKDGASNADSVFRCNVDRAMYLAASLGTYITASITYAGVNENSLIRVIRELQELGYVVASPSTTTITVAWTRE